jgi:hypothetical protein
MYVPTVKDLKTIRTGTEGIGLVPDPEFPVGFALDRRVCVNIRPVGQIARSRSIKGAQGVP